MHGETVKKKQKIKLSHCRPSDDVKFKLTLQEELIKYSLLTVILKRNQL